MTRLPPRFRGLAVRFQGSAVNFSPYHLDRRSNCAALSAKRVLAIGDLAYLAVNTSNEVVLLPIQLAGDQLHATVSGPDSLPDRRMKGLPLWLKLKDWATSKFDDYSRQVRGTRVVA
jgi:hypothetical protein